MAKIENMNFEYTHIINMYLENSQNKDFANMLRKLNKKMKLISKLGQINFIRDSSRDTKGFFKLLDELSKF